MTYLVVGSINLFFLLLFTLDHITPGRSLSFNQMCSNFTCRHGECEQNKFDYTCHCRYGVKGLHCDRQMQPNEVACNSNPCWNGGTCNIVNRDDRHWQCSCPAGTLGPNCRLLSRNLCYDGFCNFRGVCIQKNNITAECACFQYYTGSRCESEIQLCDRPTPCYNGGTCINNQCKCKANFYGTQCQTYAAPNLEKVVKVLNKGWYIANVEIKYRVGAQEVTQRATIALNQNIVFHIPYVVNIDGVTGIRLRADAVAGVTIMNIRIKANPECFHVWGTTLFPAWSSIDCSGW